MLSQYKTQVRLRSAPYHPCKKRNKQQIEQNKKDKLMKKMKLMSKSKSFPVDKQGSEYMAENVLQHLGVSPTKLPNKNFSEASPTTISK